MESMASIACVPAANLDSILLSGCIRTMDDLNCNHDNSGVVAPKTTTINRMLEFLLGAVVVIVVPVKNC